MTKEQRKFIRDLERVSTILAVWAQGCFENDWSIDDVKVHLRAAVKIIDSNNS